jgi:hypothetical protein
VPTYFQKYRDLAVEWFLGAGLPAFVTGVLCTYPGCSASLISLAPFLDYTEQGTRFEVYEGFGCSTGYAGEGIDILLFESWAIVLPLVSTIFYCRKMFYHLAFSSNAHGPSQNYLCFLSAQS